METRSRQIDRNEWKQFFDRISRHYKGRKVSVERIKRGEGVHSLAKDLPFIGLTFEAKDPKCPSVELMAGGTAGPLVGHAMSSPERVWMRQEANGGDNALGIESSDGSTLVIEFTAAETKVNSAGEMNSD